MENRYLALLAALLLPLSTHGITRSELKGKCSVLKMPTPKSVFDLYHFTKSSDLFIRNALDCVRAGSAKCRANERKAQIPLAQAASVLTCIEKQKPRSPEWGATKWGAKDVQKLQDLTQQYLDVISKKCYTTYIKNIDVTIDGSNFITNPVLTNNNKSC